MRVDWKHPLFTLVNWLTCYQLWSYMLYWVTHTWLSSLTPAQILNPNSHHSPQFDAGPGFEQARIDSLPISPAQQGIDTAFRRPLRGGKQSFYWVSFKWMEVLWRCHSNGPLLMYMSFQWPTDGLQRGYFLNECINIYELKWRLCMKSEYLRFK